MTDKEDDLKRAMADDLFALSPLMALIESGPDAFVQALREKDEIRQRLADAANAWAIDKFGVNDD